MSENHSDTKSKIGIVEGLLILALVGVAMLVGIRTIVPEEFFRSVQATLLG